MPTLDNPGAVQLAHGRGRTATGAATLAWHRQHGMRATVEEIKRLYALGQDRANWYDGAREWLEARWGDRAVTAAYVLAATSPLTSVQVNVRRTRTIMAQFVAGDESWRRMRVYGLATPNVLANLARAAKGEEPTGPKCRAYARAILGDTTAVVVDRHMFGAWFGRADGSLSQGDLIRCWVTYLADALGQPARDTQAAVWAGAKRAYGRDGFDDQPLVVHLETVWGW